MKIELSIEEIRKRKLELIRIFCRRYENVVLIVKDCNSCIGCNRNIFVNSEGSPALAKAGTGDVLAGLVAALLSQGYSALQACITASLAHAFAGKNIPNNYSLTASELIEKVAKL